MNRRTIGMIFIIIAAFLYGVRYISAAIFGSGLSTWSKELFEAMLLYVGDEPLYLSILALVIGGLCLIWPDRDRMKKIINYGLSPDNQRNKNTED